MKKIILLLSLFLCMYSFGQKKTREERQAELDAKAKSIASNDELKTNCGYKIVKNEYIKIGVGSMPDGDFKFIRRHSNSIFSYYSTTGYQGMTNQANAFPRSESGLKYKVKDIEKRGNEKRGYVNYIKIGMGIVNYEIDVENAIASGEIEVPNEFKSNIKKDAQNSIVSVSDELLKLKKLFDEGVLTKEEFDTQKKKLLEK